MSSHLWESERQRAVVYVEGRRRARLSLRDSIFRRINAHCQVTEVGHYQRQYEESQQQDMEIDLGLDMTSDNDSETTSAPEAEALALDFLGDVDENDMRTLLVESATTTTTSQVVTMETVPPVVATALSPLSMPTHLLSTASAASVNTTALSGVAVGASMGENTGVSELMDELQIDVKSLAATTTTVTTTTTTTRSHEPEEEQKTEESAPPRHVQGKGENLTHKHEVSGSSSKPPVDGALKSAWKDVFDPETAAANEMIGWVTGKNDPEVIKRLETLRGDKKRKVTKRFGTDTYPDQATIRRVAKYHSGEGVSSSSSSDESKSDSDFSPQEVVEIDDEEEDEVSSEAELVEDDFVDEEDQKTIRKKKPTRRRIRQRPRTNMTIKTPPPAPMVRKSTKRTLRIENDESEEEGTVAQVEQKTIQASNEPQAIDLRSDSEIEPEPDVHKDESAGMGRREDLRPSSSETVEGSTKTDLVAEANDTPQDLEEPKMTSIKEGALQTAQDSPKSNVSISASQDVPVSDAPDETAQDVPTSEVRDDTSAEIQLPMQMDGDDDEGYGTEEIIENDPELEDYSDTGTIDLEQEEMMSQLEEGSKGSPASVPTGVVNDVLNPIEPQVKMSPQHTTPPPSARVLQPEPSTVKKGSQSDQEVVDAEEATSDIDFGSGESEDFGGDVSVVAGDEAEFGQFFERPRYASPQTNAPVGQSADATPVTKITTENLVSSPSLPVITKQNTTRATAAASSSPAEKGSNGLRKVPNINTTTTAKGKYKHTRHAIRLLDDNMKVTNVETSVHDPKEKLISRSRILSNVPPPSGEVSPRTIRPLLLRRSQSEDNGKPGDARYLNYERPQSQARARPNIKETIVNAAKEARERHERKVRPNASAPQAPVSFSHQPQKPIVIFDTTSVGTGSGVLKPIVGSVTLDGVYLPPKEPQLDIYKATGAISNYDSDDAPLSLSAHKRPSRFVKEVDEAKKKGIDVRKVKPEELDPKARIPRKSLQQLAHERQISNDGKRGDDDGSNHGSVTSPPKSKRAKTNKSSETNGQHSKYGPSAGSKASMEDKRAKPKRQESGNGRSSHYGPSSSSNLYSSSHQNDDYSRRGSESKKRARSPAPKSYDRDRDLRRRPHKGNRERDDGRSHGCERERDHGSDRQRDRSRSSSQSRHRHHHSQFRTGRRSESPARQHSSHDRHSRRIRRSRSRSASRSASREESRYREDGERSVDKDPRSIPSYASVDELSQVESNHGVDKKPRLAERVRSDSRAEKRNAGALASFGNDDGSDIAPSDIEFVDDFDDEDGQVNVLNIQYNLTDIRINHEERERMVYVCNLAPQVDEEQLTEMFQKYGIAENPEIGCPAVEVFLCQRSHRPRGDARITFTSPQAAAIAAKEVNASITDSKLLVRQMDEDTMRILHAQFDVYRDTWICPNPDCHAEVSTWTRHCGMCKHHRVFPPSNVKVRERDWLCKVCFATNAPKAGKCNCCGVHLPPTRGE